MKTNNFFRILFALPDTFNLNVGEFLNHLLTQCLRVLSALTYGVKDGGYSGKIQSQPISTFLDRIFVRYHSDSEHFHGGIENNPFVAFVNDVAELCQKDFVTRRLFSKALLGIGSHSGGKLAKTMFLVGHKESWYVANYRSKCNTINVRDPRGQKD
jgi:hypothetical protein